MNNDDDNKVITCTSSLHTMINGEFVVFLSANWADDNDSALIFVDSNNTSPNNDGSVVNGNIIVYVADITNDYADIINDDNKMIDSCDVLDKEKIVKMIDPHDVSKEKIVNKDMIEGIDNNKSVYTAIINSNSNHYDCNNSTNYDGNNNIDKDNDVDDDDYIGNDSGIGYNNNVVSNTCLYDNIHDDKEYEFGYGIGMKKGTHVFSLPIIDWESSVHRVGIDVDIVDGIGSFVELNDKYNNDFPSLVGDLLKKIPSLKKKKKQISTLSTALSKKK